MPHVNGEDQAEMPPEYKLMMGILEAMRDTWKDQFAKSGVDAVMFSRVSVVALSQLAAVVAVDVGMNPDQFTNVCSANFTEAFKRAPRFG